MKFNTPLIPTEKCKQIPIKKNFLH